MARDPLIMVEIDMEYCALTFAAGVCTARLGVMVPVKCFNTYATCSSKAAFSPNTKVLKFCENRANLPRISGLFPALLSVSEISSSVNIAGADDRVGALGRRATVSIEFADFPYHDRALDKYQSQRIRGAAQFDGVGYNPSDRGTFFSRLAARWPYYAGRALRIVQGYISDDGQFVPELTRAYVLTGWQGPDSKGRVTIRASDVFYLADNAVAPVASVGVLAADLAAGGAGATLLPAGIGDASYPAAGVVCIGGEIAAYTRAGDALTLTARGQRGTAAKDHAAGDTVQLVLSFANARPDDVLEILLRDFAKVPQAMIPKDEWRVEISRWMPNVFLNTDICAPVKVSTLVAELALLGLSIFPSEAGDKIKLFANHPPDGVEIQKLTDFDNIISVSVDDRQDGRLTEVVVFHNQLDPTKGSEIANYSRAVGVYDFDAKGPRAYGDTRPRRIFTRWLNSAADDTARILALRLLNRFVSAPAQWRVVLDAKDAHIGLADVFLIESASIQDATGAPAQRLAQVVSRVESIAGHELEVILQAYDFLGRYGFITYNDWLSYSDASISQRFSGSFVAPNSGFFADGSQAYKVI